MSARRSGRVQALATRAKAEYKTGEQETPPLLTSAPPKPQRKRKATKPSSSAANENNAAASAPADAMPPPPSTPQKKRKLAPAAPASPAKPPPLTPTPSAVGLMASPSSTDATAAAEAAGSAARKRRTRPAGPHITNATLQTPRGSTLVAQPSDWLSSSPSKANADPPTTTTTENLLERACAHLVAADPALAPLVAQHHCALFAPAGLAEKIDPFAALVRGICAQQVSGAAARSILNKFIGLFNDASVAPDAHVFPTPAQVAPAEIARLRTAGLSERKAEYIKGLAEKFASGELSAQMLLTASDEEILERLTAVRGLGRWSVEMFACFSLKRMDIFSTGDLGVQRGMACYVGKDVAKLKAKGGGKWKYMSEQDMLDISAKFAPYRSLFMWYMWRIEDVDIEALQGTAKPSGKTT